MFHVPEDQVTSDQRSKAKVLSFAVPYGASAMGMWQKGLGETLEEAEKLLNDFFTAFPNVKKYLDKQVADAMTLGRTQDYYGRLRWYEIPKDASEDEVHKISKRIKRQAQNFGIQALSASVTKKAIVDLHDFFESSGWGYLILTVHDSVFFEIKNEHLDESLRKIKEIMEGAGPAIMPKLQTPIDFDLGDIITKTDKISGKKFSVYALEWDKETQTSKPNSDLMSEETIKNLKYFDIQITDDLQGIRQQLLDKFETAPVEWLEKNNDWVESVKNLK